MSLSRSTKEPGTKSPALPPWRIPLPAPWGSGRSSPPARRSPARGPAAADAPPRLHADDMPEVHGARVLLVEDNPVNMLIAATMLEQWGVDVEQASDGAQALAAVARASAMGRRFDAVLMDVQMPTMSGYEATREIRREHGAEALPIIALTAAALVTERDEALAAGMNDFLTKPIDPDRLRATLARWVSWRAALRT